MSWKNLKVGKKISIGIGSVIALLVILSIFAVTGIGKIVEDGKEVAYGNNLTRMITEKEIDHLNWASALNKFLTDSSQTELNVEMDHKKCAFGKWLFSDERILAEKKVPELKALFSAIEEPHERLHDTAKEIDEVFVRADHSLPELFAKMEVAHLNWAESVIREINQGKKKLSAEIDHHKCGFGKIIFGERGRKIAQENEKIGRLFEQIKPPHKQLHESANTINAHLAAGDRDAALKVYMDVSIPVLNEVRGYLHQIVRVANEDIANEKIATDIYQNDTIPTLERIRALLAQVKKVAGQNIMSQDVMIEEGNNTQVMVITLSVIALVVGVILAFVIIKAITTPITGLMDSIVRVEQTANFGERCKVDRTDEIGLVGSAFNNLLESLQAVIKAANNSMGKVAVGDFSQKIESDAVGDLESLKNGINQTVDNINGTFVSLNEVMNSLSEADYSRQINIPEMKGEYKKVVDAGMDSMNNSGNAINAINNVMGTVAQGEFDKRVDIRLPGDLGVLKDNINKSLDVVKNGIEDTTRITVSLSKGDLTQRVEANHPGQFGVLKKALNETMDNLRSVVLNIAQASDVVQSASSEIAQGNADMSKRTEEQASSLEETASSLEELTGTVQQNAENAKRANQLSKSAADTAGQGGSIVKDAVNAMEEISTSSSRIVDIIGVIDEIAFQTNLLALNASVEAARAGEQGRGFAVVATEVRNLAQRSATAAKEIKELIQDSVGKVKVGSDLVEKSGETLEEIVAGVKKVGDMIAEIAAASQEQTTGIGQINQAIANMDDITQRNAALAEEASANSENLNAQANKMNQEVKFFDI